MTIAIAWLLMAAQAGSALPSPPDASAARTMAEASIVAEAQTFMAAYAEELRRGDRAAIASRYDRGGAWLLGHGEKSFSTWAALAARYAGPEWQPPASFVWRDLTYLPAGPEAVIVIGRFEWGPANGRPPLNFSYTAMLVRQDGQLRIRLEDESGARPATN